MAKISNQIVYPEDHAVSKEDYLIGTDKENRLKTKTYPVGSVMELIKTEIEQDLNIPRKTSDLVNDGEDGVNKFITKKDIAEKVYQFSNMADVHIIHGQGRYVDVEIIIGVNKVLADVEFMDDLNSIIVKNGRPETGIIIIR